MASHYHQYDSLPSYEDPRPSVWITFKDTFLRNPVEPAKDYLTSLFPIATWIYRYNLTWLYGDLIAGVSVGMVLVPQGMSYAKIATLPPQYGLYSSFVGVLIYCLFATSKDISIGPVAVMSLQVSKVIEHVVSSNESLKGQEVEIAVSLALLCGAIALGIGLLRLGFIIEFIPIPAIVGFMTGSAISIVVGQVPGLFGINKLFNTRAATYQVIIDTLKHLGHTNMNAAFGLVTLFILYACKWFFAWGGKRWPRLSRTFFFATVMRNGVVIIFATLIAWGVCRSYKKDDYPISVLGEVPRGFQHVGAPNWNIQIFKDMAGELPISVVVLVLEHIAISKSFGRVNDYKINPNQELVAIGVTNMIGTLFHAYPATGSFSRSALKSKCGVRTPLAGIYTAVVILLALYALTEAFQFIPNASLSAVIIHAVGDLVSHPKTTWRFWRSSPIEAVIFVVAVILTVFTSIEDGIYFAVGASLVLLLLRVAFPSGQFLGRVEYCQVNNPTIQQPVTNSEPQESVDDSDKAETPKDHKNGDSAVKTEAVPGAQAPSVRLDNKHKRYKWVPLSHKSINPDVRIRPPPPGVFVYRPTESFTYPNCSRQSDKIVDEIKKQTRRGISIEQDPKLGDRPWNDNGPRHRKPSDDVDSRPLLRALVFDFSATPHIDLTGVQSLVDTRQALDKYANRKVEYHFVGLMSPWSRRALVSEGFGGDENSAPEYHHVQAAPRIDPRFQGQEEGFDDSASLNSDEVRPRYSDEEERDTASAFDADSGEFVPVVGTNTPFFHFDIPDLDEHS